MIIIIIIITRSNNVSKVVSRNLKIAFSLRDNKNPSLRLYNLSTDSILKTLVTSDNIFEAS